MSINRDNEQALENKPFGLYAWVRLITRIAGSTAIWILLCVVVFDYFLNTVHPLQFVNVRGGTASADQQPLNDKLELLSSGTKKPDFLVFGSSLAIAACFGSDWASEGRQFYPDFKVWRYTATHYLDSLLSNKFHQTMNGYNLSVAGCMISDECAILEDVLSHGVRPKMLVITIAPRDFIDNSVSSVEGSSYRRVVSDRKNGLQISASNTLAANTEQILQHCWQFFKVRGDYHRTIELIVCSAFGRASNLYYAATGKSFDRKTLSGVSLDINLKPYADPEPASVPNDLELYSRRYLPFNEKRLAIELDYLKELLATCKKNGILPIVVNMPLQPSNLRLLGRQRIEQISNAEAETCRSYGVSFIDYSTKNFPVKYFHDSCHLRPAGAMRFFDELTDIMQKDGAFCQRVAATFGGKTEVALSENDSSKLH